MYETGAPKALYENIKLLKNKMQKKNQNVSILSMKSSTDTFGMPTIEF